jgi:hypothetical protein
VNDEGEVHIPAHGSYCLTGRGLVVLGSLHEPSREPAQEHDDVRAGRGPGLVLTVWSMSAGQVGGVEVSGLVVVSVGDRRQETTRQLLLVDDRAGPEQLRWLLDAFQGRMGGPLRDLAAPDAAELGFCRLPLLCRLEEDVQSISGLPWLSLALVAVPTGEDDEDDEDDEDRRGPVPAPSPLGTGGSCWTVDSVSWATGGFVSWPERGLEWDLEGCTGVFGRFRIET